MNKRQKHINRPLLLSAILIMAGFSSCVSNKAPHIPDDHTPEISMSWPGVYMGLIPAADGPGIDVQITLN
jgi:hypothetical protein